MNRPKMEDSNGTRVLTGKWIEDTESYIDYLELRITRLTEGLNDIVITLQNMQRDGNEN